MRAQESTLGGSNRETPRARLLKTIIIPLAVALLSAHPAHAVLQCPKADSLDDSRKNQKDEDQDNRFREECLKLENVAGIKPPACMTGKDTNHHFAPIISKYLYTGVKHPSMVYRSYTSSQGVRYGSLSYREKSGLFGVGGCKSPNFKPDDSKATIRSAYNNCANQYILTLRHDPHIIFEAQGDIKHKDCTTVPESEKEDCQLKNIDPTDCQPFKLNKLSDEDNKEVDVRKYLTRAAQSVGVQLKDKDPKSDSDSDGNKNNDDLPKTINDLVVPFDEETYERIYDPSHPFSPRHDFLMNERMLSYIVNATYENQRQSEPSESKCAVACASVPVDIMTFRMKDYGMCIGGRMVVNIMCWATQFIKPYDWCYGPLSDEGKFPPCSTRYDVKDNMPGWCEGFGKIDECCAKLRKPIPMINALKLREYNWSNFGAPEKHNKVIPNVMRFNKNFGDHMPYMRWWDTGRAAGQTSGSEDQDPKNTLGSEDAIVGIGREAPDGSDGAANLCRMAGPSVNKTAEELANALASQLGGNMGQLLQGMINPMNQDIASQIASMVSPPGMDLDFADQTMKKALGKIQNMGPQIGDALGGFASQIGQQLKNQPNGDLDWMEYKLYQARTIAKFHLACIGRYEKLWKPFSSEEMVLSRLGYGYDIKQLTDDEIDAMSEDEQKKYLDTRAIMGLWPHGWRGYASAHMPNRMFPIAFKDGQVKDDCTLDNQCPRANLTPYKYLKMGLDNVRRGDVIVYNQWLAFRSWPGDSSLPDRVPVVAYVLEAQNKEAYKGHEGDMPEHPYVDVLEWNNGKIPDACGNTEALGTTASPRRLYKSSVPLEVKIRHAAANDVPINPATGQPMGSVNSSCYDPDLKECVEGLWDNIMFYRPRCDRRGYNFDDYSIGGDTHISNGEDGKMDACDE